MRASQYFALLAAAASAVDAVNPHKLPLVKSKALQRGITRNALSTKAHELEAIAYSTPDRNRVMSSEGHEKTVEWITGYLDEMKDYYTYKVQPFIALFSNSNGTFAVEGEEIESEAFEYSPSGDVEADIVAVDNLGCEASDFPSEVEGNIALISRGECEFGLKSALAGAAGAVAAIIYNSEDGLIGGGTLGTPPRPEGDYVPTLGIALADGEAILDDLEGGNTVTGTVVAQSDIRNVTTYNVIAETKCGDHDNVLALGAHSDSVFAGPGINDDGSGTIGILEAAIQLSNYKTNNAVRFCWWSGEEYGLLGSTYYVENLNSTRKGRKELDKIKLYLNFDMLASPNYIFATFDGDGSRYGLVGAEVEQFYRDWFKSHDYNITATAFDGRSDYQAFADNGIPCGGLFAGADETKTRRLVEKFGGTQGIPCDPNYHTAEDNYDNLNFEAWVPIEKALMASVAKYATSFDTLPAASKVRARGIEDGKRMRRALQDDRFEVKGHAKLRKL
jgi:carboxypeptidase Q